MINSRKVEAHIAAKGKKMNDLAFFRREDTALFFANCIPFICRIIYNKWRIRIAGTMRKKLYVFFYLIALLTRCNKFVIIFSIMELYLQLNILTRVKVTIKSLSIAVFVKKYILLGSRVAIFSQMDNCVEIVR